MERALIGAAPADDVVQGMEEPGVIRLALDRLGAGQRTAGRLRVGCMASGQPIELPWLALKGARSGKCLWINGAVHGDEVNGVLSALDFFRSIDATAVSGSVVVTPVSNPLGFDGRKKRTPQDELDLDQTYPGRDGGLTSELLAWRLFEEVKGVADVLVNFHTMNPYFDSRPYVVYKADRTEPTSESDLLMAAAAFEPFVACRMPVSGGAELPGNVAGALDYQASQFGALAFMVELGGGSRQQPDYVQQGVRGLKGLASHIRLLPAPPSASVSIRRITVRRHVMCRQGGLFRQKAHAGTMIPAGQGIGEIEDLFGRVVEEIAFPDPVALIGIRSDPVVHSGDRIGLVGLEWDDVALNA